MEGKLLKKYWKLISLTILTIIIIGTFYIQSSPKASVFSDIYFKKQAGDVKEIQDVIIEGNLLSEHHSSYIAITNNESTSMNRLPSIYEQIKSDTTPEIERLRKEYGSFMRGKSNSGDFYENDDLLIYIDTIHSPNIINGNANIDIEASVLDKKKQEKRNLDIHFPNEEKYDYIAVNRVWFDGEKIKVVATIDKHPQGELHVYAIDWKTGEIVNDELAFQYAYESNNSNQYTDVHVVDSETIQTDPFFIFEKNTYEDIEAEPDMYESQVIEKELMKYDLQTDKIVKLKLPNELQNIDFPTQNGHLLMFTRQSEKEIEIINYDIQSENIASKRTFDIAGDNSEEAHIKIKNGKIYIVTPYKNMNAEAILFVGDSKTGDTLYRGTLEVDGMKESKNYEFYIEYLGIEDE